MYTYTYMYIYIYIIMYMIVYVYKLHYRYTIHIYIYIMYVYIYVYIYMYIYIYKRHHIYIFINVHCAKIPGVLQTFFVWLIFVDTYSNQNPHFSWRCLRMWGSLPINSPGCTDNVRKVLHPFLLCQGPHDAHHAALIIACQIQIDLSARRTPGLIWWNSRLWQVTQHQLSSHSKNSVIIYVNVVFVLICLAVSTPEQILR